MNKLLLSFYRGPLTKEDAETVVTEIPERVLRRHAWLDRKRHKWLHRVFVKRRLRRSGLGTEVMEDTMRFADKMGYWLLLRVRRFDEKALSNAQLRRWYARWGFTPVQGERDIMCRAPLAVGR